MDTAFRMKIWPENVISLSPDPQLMKQFKRQGTFNTQLPLFVMRTIVHLATRFMTPRLYTGKFRSKYVKRDVEGSTAGLRITRPATNEVLPALMYIHGGGGLLTDSSSYIRVLKNIASAANVVVGGLDYRRGPECPFPAGLDDAVAALRWMHENAASYHFDVKRISIAGDSAGGNLVAGLALRNRNNASLPIYKQVLINARLTHIQHFPSIDRFAEGYGLTRTAMEFFASRYFRFASDAETLYASPLDAPDLSHLPPALIITSEYDPLRDEGEAYAAALHAAGVTVEATRFAGMAHTMVVFGTTKEAAAACMKLIAAAVQ